MTVTLKRYGTLKGEPLYEITLVNHQGMTVDLLNYGATLERVRVPAGHQLVDVILHLAQPSDYSEARNLLGGTVGRIIARVPGHTWHRGEAPVSLPANEGANTIHGGPDGLDMQAWNLAYREGPAADQVTFTLVDFGGHNGFPGNVKTTVAYTLDDDNRLTYALTAATDQMTLFNATNHVYFALDGPDSTVAQTTLQLASDYYGPLAANHLPSGWAAVTGTPFDFRQPRRLGEVMPLVLGGAGLDHPFLLKHDQAATLTGASGRAVTMTTTAPAVVVYTGNHWDEAQGAAAHLRRHSGVTLEAQVAPPSGQDWSAITLMPGDPYQLQTTWQFKF
ncbi:aldose epimerase family protein [Lacticaseibacillus suibinensis]|uniref:aldose epimerase family protein n=1 Tax=Lacticaseibacillus suibinensis TaxID=2486011 RepID=UPI00194183B1|nr:aldose epimerase family protein [Lacticaseibacillus suibinensis]